MHWKRTLIFVIMALWAITGVLNIASNISIWERIEKAVENISASTDDITTNFNDISLLILCIRYYLGEPANIVDGDPSASYVLIVRGVADTTNPDSPVYGINISISVNNQGLDPVLYQTYWYNSQIQRDISLRTIQRVSNIDWSLLHVETEPVKPETGEIRTLQWIGDWITVIFGMIYFICMLLVAALTIIVNLLLDTILITLQLLTGILQIIGILPTPV